MGTCLGFAEITLGILANSTGRGTPTLVAAFAVIALGMVLTALVVMYWRDPAFLTFRGDQALDLRKLEAILERMPPELVAIYFDEIASREFTSDRLKAMYRIDSTVSDEIETVEQQLDLGES